MSEIVLVCGDRNWAYNEEKKRGWAPGDRITPGGPAFDDWVMLGDRLRLIDDEVGISEIVEGGANGADSLGGEWALANDRGLQVFEADWKQFGKAAGPIRNELQLSYIVAKRAIGIGITVVAFHRNIAVSRGTGHMIKIARKAGVPVEVYPEGQE